MTKEISIPDDYDIYWEKWVDPYENIMPTSIQSAYSEEDDEEKEEYEEEALHIGIKSVLTPFGLLPLNENSLVSNSFKLWTGHTNFKFTKDFCKILRFNIKGLEAADIDTNYRFRIAVAKLFSDRIVMNNIKKQLVKYARELYGPFSQT